MSPDRGFQYNGETSPLISQARPVPVPAGRSFTLRGILVGLLVGLIICFSNMYFGLQTGWVSTMTLPASLLGFGLFRMVSKHIRLPFTPVENVLVQTVAGSMAIMPLGCGFVGVLPAMNFLLSPEEQGPIHLSKFMLVIWALGLCYFGVVFAVPLRRQVIIRERLRFPSGFSTAVLIGVLHGQTPDSGTGIDTSPASGTFASLVPKKLQSPAPLPGEAETEPEDGDVAEDTKLHEWAANIKLLIICFGVSGFFTLTMYFFPVLRSLPIFGRAAAQTWLWTFNPSLAYVGQGIIMGVETTLHMTLGAVVGWGILSPLAHRRGWAPGPIDDWDSGSKGWIVWVSLSIMLADAVINLAHIPGRVIVGLPRTQSALKYLRSLLSGAGRRSGYSAVSDQGDEEPEPRPRTRAIADPERESLIAAPGDLSAEDPDNDDEEKPEDAPEDQLVSNRVIWIGLVASILLCISTIHIVFGDLMPLYATVLAVAVALVLSVMGVRALGETDLNPVSGISKLAQLFFAFVIPASHKSAVLINLVSGAVAEAGALQAGELMQDLKTGHLLGAAPKAQFWGQVIGATVGAVVSAFIYQLYTSVYTIPGDLFQVPTAFVWIFTARLVTGKGLPPMAKQWAIGSGLVFSLTTIARIFTADMAWRPIIPGGIAVAVGMYNVPSFTLARAVGGVFSWYWTSVLKRSNTPLIIMASGFILGEGFLSIVNLLLESLGVPHH
ncbi:related to permeases - unknown function [Cephalotrichum gorgonifer]|uniref:OPT domain-containing protein n=1 Tax=Cephalotrichum gorgonifer TaxID=2041049 RepID=A0AAE8MWP5_9PEZI|nr:related to permeases - unknown function [Cephalotrichum gorgonifer]